MRCHYEVLGIAPDASSADIKRAYRDLALKNHPDKNPDDFDAANERFQEIVTAFGVLSDKQERAWYDNHRESILRGGGGDDESEEDELNLWPYFSSSYFKGYADGEDNGFYAVYERVFKEVNGKEEECLRHSGQAPPAFGDGGSSWEDVQTFYNHWSAFVTCRPFGWADKYKAAPSEVEGGRRVRRIMEQENKKARDAARKKYTDVVRRLVKHVRNLDKRVKFHELRIKRERKARADANERKRREALEQQRVEQAKAVAMLAERQEASEEHQEYWATLDELMGMWADDSDGERSESDDVSGSEVGVAPVLEEDADITGIAVTLASASLASGNESGTAAVGPSTNKAKADPSEFYCVACSKKFRSAKQWENHERSKKHREKVAYLRDAVQLDEDDDLPLEQHQDDAVLAQANPDVSLLDNDGDVVAPLPTSQRKKNKKRQKQRRRGMAAQLEPVSDEEAPIATDDAPITLQMDEEPASNGTDAATQDADEDDHLSVEEMEHDGHAGHAGEEAGGEDYDVIVTAAGPSHEGTGGAGGVEGSTQTTPSAGPSASASQTPKAAESWPCVKCGEVFQSRNKLYRHLDSTGHTALLNEVPAHLLSKKNRKLAKQAQAGLMAMACELPEDAAGGGSGKGKGRRRKKKK